MDEQRESYVIGVDFGTLSGRAVVVRVSDGAELGTARRTTTRTRVIDRRPARRPTPLPPGLGAAGPRRLRRRAAHRRARGASRAAGVDPARRRSASAPTSPPAPMLPDPRRRHPAVRAARVRRTGRTPTSSCGSTTPRSRRPTGSTRWPHERGEPWLAALRRADLLGVGVRQGPAGARGGPRGLRRDGPLGRGRRLDRLAALRHLRPQRLHRRLQGHPARTAPTRRREFLAALNPDFADFVADKLEHPIGQLGARAGGLTAAGRGLDRPARGHRGGGRQRRRPRHRARPPQAVGAGPDGRDHGHLDLPRDERRRRCARCPGMCGVVDGGIIAGPLGLRGRAERRRRHLRLVRRHQRAGRLRARPRPRPESRCTSTSPTLAAAAARSASTAWSRWTGTAATARCWSTTSCPGVIVGPDPGHPARGHLPGAARGHRVRHPHDRRGVRRRPASRSTELVVAGGLLKNALLMQIYADVTDLPLSTIDSDAGPGARLGDPRRGRRRRATRTSLAAAAGDGPLEPRRLPARPGRAPTPTTSSTPSTCSLHDYFGRGANDVMHRLKARRRADAEIAAGA